MKVSKKQKAISLSEPVSLKYGTRKHNIKDTLIVPIKKISNGGARIQLSGDFSGYLAIVLITDEKVIS